MSGVRIKEVLEGGAAHKDGFLKVNTYYLLMNNVATLYQLTETAYNEAA